MGLIILTERHGFDKHVTPTTIFVRKKDPQILKLCTIRPLWMYSSGVIFGTSGSEITRRNPSFKGVDNDVKITTNFTHDRH